MSEPSGIWGKRLKEIRLAEKYSQMQLGIEAGLDAGVASARINRYELGTHKADYKIAQMLAKVLNVPTGYFYTEDDRLAELMLIYHRSSATQKAELHKAAQTLVKK